MKTLIVALALAVFSTQMPAPSYAQERGAQVQEQRVSLFRVPWQCPAAPEIACGGVAKPILLELEADPNISEAWVNRAGTVLAVVGSDRSSRESRAKIVQSLLLEIFEKQVATEIDGEARQSELARFSSNDGWYRGAQVDDLSREEADIIGARLVRRIQTKAPLTDEKASALAAAFANVFKGRFLSDPAAPASSNKTSGKVSKAERDKQLMTVARERLDPAGVAAFEEALRMGHRPLSGEK
ncbi:hypothetical protein OVY29_21350 [Sphingopyxis sp. SE2]|uniref:hypothetical protein n=1 Tax=Sphingopyxis sp. SE2 TaxID=1586240 RepID=UPI0028C220CA|nr:hypothetical protein [Sphingopyxis sp. SE2]MDT7531214.1 hypothetical protein [Sphingopyxis sp. SE2]